MPHATLVSSLDEKATQAIREELLQHSELFGQSPRVTYEGSAHAEVHDIILRGPVVKDTDTLSDLHDRIECMDYMDYGKFPVLKNAIDEFVADREVGRVIITALQPNGIIYPHNDEGSVPEYYDRYHYCVQGGIGNVFLVGNQGVQINTGEMYLIDVSQKHAVVNLMDAERVHCIIDVKHD